MAPKADFGRLAATLLQALRSDGELEAAAVLERLGVSTATLSRLVAQMQESLLVVGKARATRYLARRQVEDLEREIPIFEVLDDGTTRELGLLIPVMPKGFHFASAIKGAASRTYSDLPWFLNDLRPAGFLGSAIPRQHPELGLPTDLRSWSAETCLRYLSRCSWNHGGSLVVGETALAELLQRPVQPVSLSAFPQQADKALEFGQAGSSAAGEQAKFLAWLAPAGPHQLVKFSNAVTGDPVDQRIADLLVCEHLALETITEAGHSAARSSIHRIESQVFLAVERFDRVGPTGRVGSFSLLNVHAEFSEAQGGWTTVLEDLAKQKLAPREAVDETRWLEYFGQLIANNDMHFGNLSFLARGTRIESLAPAYDMSPMLYFPLQNRIVERTFEVPAVPARHAAAWTSAWQAACRFWQAAAAHELISPAFRQICAANAAKLESLADVVRRLPR